MKTLLKPIQLNYLHLSQAFLHVLGIYRAAGYLLVLIHMSPWLAACPHLRLSLSFLSGPAAAKAGSVGQQQGNSQDQLDTIVYLLHIGLVHLVTQPTLNSNALVRLPLHVPAAVRELIHCSWQTIHPLIISGNITSIQWQSSCQGLERQPLAQTGERSALSLACQAE